MPAELRLSIVIPTHDRHDRMARAVGVLVSQIVAAGLSDDAEVIVVDDGSPSDSAARTRAFIDGQGRPFLRCLPLSPNRGASGARNAGAAASRGAIVAFLDDDIVPGDNYVRAVIAAHERHPAALVINGTLLPLRPGIYADFWFHYYDHTFNRPGQDFYTVPMLASGHFSLKRALLAVERPLFDEALTSREDLDLHMRLAQRGIPSYKDDSIVAFNDCRRTLVGFLRQRMWYTRGQEQLIAKHGRSAVVAQTVAPRRTRFLHLYLLLRLAQRAARWYEAARRQLGSAGVGRP